MTEATDSISIGVDVTPVCLMLQHDEGFSKRVYKEGFNKRTLNCEMTRSTCGLEIKCRHAHQDAV
jgi:hypothetical protein